MVFDWVTYVPNLDTFVYHDVTFSLKTSGRVVATREGRVVPLNLFDAGGCARAGRGESGPRADQVCFGCVVVHFRELFW